MHEQITTKGTEDIVSMSYGDLAELRTEEPLNHEHWPQVEEGIATLSRSTDSSLDWFGDERAIDLEENERRFVHRRVLMEIGVLRTLLEGVDLNSYDPKKVNRLHYSLDFILPYLSNERLSVDDARLAVNTLLDIDERVANASGEPRGFDKAALLLELVTPDILRQLYLDATDSRGLKERFWGLKNPGLKLRILAAVYGDDPDDTAYKQDPSARILESQIGGNDLVRRIHLMPEVPKGNTREALAEYDQKLTKESVAILMAAGYPKEHAEGYIGAASIRLKPNVQGHTTETMTIRIEALKEELASMVDKISQVSVGELTKLYEKLGVENTWAYRDYELKDLADLLNRDSAMIEHFQSGDVTVEFVDARNDYNGAIISKYSSYRNSTGRSLRFEIKDPADIYRRMVFLSNRGIKPSTLVYASHGMPGGTRYGKYMLTSGTGISEDAIPIDQTQFGRIVRDFMQPKRGDDNDDTSVGNIQVILSTCSSDVPYAYDGLRYPSLAEAVARTVGEAGGRVDVYGAPGVMREDYLGKGKVGFFVYEDPNANSEQGRLATNRLTPEQRGGMMGYPKKTYVRRMSVDGVQVKGKYG